MFTEQQPWQLCFFIEARNLAQPTMRGGIETLVLGGIAAVLAYYTAVFLRGLVVG